MRSRNQCKAKRAAKPAKSTVTVVEQERYHVLVYRLERRTFIYEVRRLLGGDAFRTLVWSTKHHFPDAEVALRVGVRNARAAHFQRAA